MSTAVQVYMVALRIGRVHPHPHPNPLPSEGEGIFACQRERDIAKACC